MYGLICLTFIIKSFVFACKFVNIKYGSMLNIYKLVKSVSVTVYKDMIWYDMIWYDMIWYALLFFL